MITTQNLIKKYSGIPVLNLPGLVINRGETFGLVGNNGAGKTTFFSLVLDLIEATEGAVFSKNQNVKQSEHWKPYTGAYLDESFLIDFLTPEEYFEFIGKLYGFSNGQLENFYTRFTEFFNGEILGKRKYIRDLSRGNQKKVGIAAALISNSEILVLDEPFPNLDPTTVIRLKNMLKEIKRSGEITMLISSHDLNHVTEVCDRIVILDHGNIVRDLKTSEQTRKELEAYFTI
ncbi:ABC transporter ATP-binding protein [candidate division KSB1 bacterium]|nr:ABC transporter ATP-binding protein [candidate division KSB1 bacterium]